MPQKKDLIKLANTMSRILLAFIFLLSLLLILSFGKKQQPKELFLKNNEIIESINNNNLKVKSIFYPKINCNGVKSSLFYEKPSRIQITSTLFGNSESELFSDEKLFWFWIRSFDANSVYFCERSNVHLTRVINPLRPEILSKVLGLDEIPSDAVVKQIGGYFEVLLLQDGYFRKIIIEDRITKQIFYKNEQAILSVDFVSVQEVDSIWVPKEIKLFWHSENMHLKMSMGTPQINIDVAPTKMPNLKKINLEDY